MINPEELRQLLQWAFCLPFFEFCEAFNRKRTDSWCHAKFPVMNSDFAKFYCGLDSKNAKLFVESFNRRGL